MPQADYPFRIRERVDSLIRELTKEPHPEPALGWTCSYTPQELILAAGLTPLRIPTSGAWAQEWTRSYLPANLCPYVHRLLQAGLSASLPPLRGKVFVDSCDPMRRLADIWRLSSDPGFFYRLDVPRRDDPSAERFFLGGLEAFGSALEELSGSRIGASDLNRAIAVINRTRRIMRELALLRALPRPGLSGSQFQSIALAAERTDRERFNELAAAFLSRSRRDLLRECRELSGVRRPRLLLAGCIAEDAGLQSLIEEAGGSVVADDLCSGMRHYRGEVAESGAKPLEAVAARYLHRLKCSRMAGRGDRTAHLVSLAREMGCDGVIFHALAFCDLHQLDLPAVQEALAEADIPCLPLEREHLSGQDAGQLRTRVQAFVELLG